MVVGGHHQSRTQHHAPVAHHPSQSLFNNQLYHQHPHHPHQGHQAHHSNASSVTAMMAAHSLNSLPDAFPWSPNPFMLPPFR